MSAASKIADRIRKLLALANSSNVNEAASAAAEAARLMNEHKLTATDVAADDGSKITELPLGAEGFMASWKFALVTGVARAFFCEAIALRVGARRKIRIVGKKDDAEVAVGVFNYVVKEIDRLADLDVETYDAREIMREGRIDVRVYKENFRKGAAEGVATRLKEETDRFKNSGERALVVVTQSKDELRDYLRNKYGASKVVDKEAPKTDAEAEAYLRGHERGEDITVPRAGAAQKYLTGTVRPRRREPEPDLFGDLFDDLFSQDGFIDEDMVGESDLDCGSDLSRGRGGRSLYRDDEPPLEDPLHYEKPLGDRPPQAPKRWDGWRDKKK